LTEQVDPKGTAWDLMGIRKISTKIWADYEGG
jgi:hypothetical protein